MKGKPLSLVVVCLVVLSLIPVGCGRHTPEAAEPMPEKTSPFLNEMEQRQWEEQGIANVKSLDAAVQLAGFPITEPGYLPEGFARTNISVTKLGASLPEEMKPKFTAINVDTFYHWEEDNTVMLVLTQSQHKSELGGGEPAELCGHQGMRLYQEANPRRINPNPLLTLGWEDDGTYYMLTGFLSGPLDEATLENIACSVGAD